MGKRFTYDKNAGVLYIQFRTPTAVADSSYESEGVVYRVDEYDQIIGITILDIFEDDG